MSKKVDRIRMGTVVSPPWATTWLLITACTLCRAEGPEPARKPYRGLLGPDSRKVKHEGKKTYLWAAGDPKSPGAQWYDFTGAAIPAAELQFGIGKDRIRAIDDPVFVTPDDPRLLHVGRYRDVGGAKLKSGDDIPVIGFVSGDEVRAYPVPLLDWHELVNDRVGGKPVTVGW